MFKLLVLFSFFAMAFARPGFLHSAPLLTTYQEEPRLAALPALSALPASVHIVEPLITTQQIVTPLLHGTVLNRGLH
ncbi:PREDICTED: uncharacterized protein LOC108966992 [Bactrocera latifrons]|uniref:uncharacterized protein LOC108966992 n=1 Tax=Bactrocera latifrons TaxID=174628 RepID=UPI0008DDE32A|nr:PREDICTED: uncharacterized protein LOC108966992 [Bactrocera latifrons]